MASPPRGRLASWVSYNNPVVLLLKMHPLGTVIRKQQANISWRIFYKIIDCFLQESKVVKGKRRLKTVHINGAEQLDVILDFTWTKKL